MKRRDLLKTGAAGLAGLLLSDSTRREAHPAEPLAVAPGYPTNNKGLQLVEVEIVNQSGVAGPLYVWIQGVDPAYPRAPEHHYYYVSDGDGNVTPTRAGPRQTFSTIKVEGARTIRLPRLAAIRVYLSFGKQLYTDVADTGIPNAVAYWLPDENFQTLFDFAELTWDWDGQPGSGNTLGGNLTQLDGFALPLKLDLVGDTRQSGGFQAANARNDLLTTIAKLPDPWAKLVIFDEKKMPLRVVCPYHGMEMPAGDQQWLFPRDQLAGYINHVWDYYTRNTLKVGFKIGAEDQNYQGRVESGRFIFQPSGRSGQEAIVFQNPNTAFSPKDFLSGSNLVYRCQVDRVAVPAPAQGVAAELAKYLGAAFMRSTLAINAQLDTLPCCT
jgi:hypothetical protein